MFIIPERRWQIENSGTVAMHRMLLSEMSYPLICEYFKCPMTPFSPNLNSKSGSPGRNIHDMMPPSFPNEFPAPPAHIHTADPPVLQQNYLEELLLSQNGNVFTNPFSGPPASCVPPPPGLTTPIGFTFKKWASKNPDPSFPPFKEFVYDAVQLTHAPLNAIVLALFYIRRLHRFNSHCTGNPTSPYRLMIAALIVACKYLYDETYSNRTWTSVGQGKFTMNEVNKMEWEFLQYIQFRMETTPSEWNEFLFELDTYLLQYWLKVHQPQQDPENKFVPNLLEEPSLKFLKPGQCFFTDPVRSSPIHSAASPFIRMPSASSASLHPNAYHPFTTPSLIQPMYRVDHPQSHTAHYWPSTGVPATTQTGYPWALSYMVPTRCSYPPYSYMMQPQSSLVSNDLFQSISSASDRFDSAIDMDPRSASFANQTGMLQI